MSNLTANPTTLTSICYQGQMACQLQPSIKESPYGYYPSLPINTFFLNLFVVLFVANIFLGIKYKTCSFTLAICFGCLNEIAAYIFRLLLIEKPWSNTFVAWQMTLITLGPTALTVGIYIIADEVIRTFDPGHSQHFPHSYFFGISEYSMVVLQVISLLVAYFEHMVAPQLHLGDIIAFIATIGQLFFLAFFLVTMIVFGVQDSKIVLREPHPEGKHRRYDERPPFFLRFTKIVRTNYFHIAITLAFLALLTRCIYRVLLTKAGWGSPLMQNQQAFLAFDSIMCAIAALSLTICHPGYCWPQMRSTVGFWRRRRAEDSEQGEDVESADSAVNEVHKCGRKIRAHASTTVSDVHIEQNVGTNMVDPSTRSTGLDL